MGPNDTFRIAKVNTHRIAIADISKCMREVNERLRQARLKAGYEKPTDAARAFGWNPITYRSHENSNRGLRPPVAMRYADAFGVTADWLLYGDKKSRVVNMTAPSELPVAELPFGGLLEAGAYREVEMYAQDQRTVRVPRDDRFPKARQVAYQIRGDSMDQVGFLDGTYVTAIDFVDFVEQYGEPRNGAYVVVQRSTDGGHTLERTVKELYRSGRNYEFRPRSSNPVHKSFTVPRAASDDGTEIAIVGVVTAKHDFLNF